MPKRIHLLVRLKVRNLLNRPDDGSGICWRLGRLLATFSLVANAVVAISFVNAWICRGMLRYWTLTFVSWYFQERGRRDPLATVQTRTPTEYRCRHNLVEAPYTCPVRTRIQLEAYLVIDVGTTNVTRDALHGANDWCALGKSSFVWSRKA